MIFTTLAKVPLPIRNQYYEEVTSEPTKNIIKREDGSFAPELLETVTVLPFINHLDRKALINRANINEAYSLELAIHTFHEEYLMWLRLEPLLGTEDHINWLSLEPKKNTVFITKNIKIKQGKLLRNNQRYSLIEVDGLTFDSDEQSYKNLVGSLANWTTLINDSSLLERQAIVDGKLLWVLADNSTVYLTQQQIQNVVDAIAVRVVNLQLDYMAVKNT